MHTIETDYLVIGAGASGMAFVDALIEAADVDVVLVDRRHQPGGHWLDAYPFVRLHQPSAYYGVNSSPLGSDRRMTTGPEVGWYERASGPELCDYYRRVLDERLLPSGQVRYFGPTEYAGEDPDGHLLVSRLSGRPTRVVVRRAIVDATYVESTIPSRHVRSFAVDDGVTIVSPNQLVDVVDGSKGFTVLGGGKTAMDTCGWLLERGVDPDEISWIRPRDGWFVSRAHTQPLELTPSMLDYQSRMIEAASGARSGLDLALRLEAHDMMLRIDRDVDPQVYRGATISRSELEQLRSIERVVRLGYVQSISEGRVHLTSGVLDVRPGTVHVDCTAPGLSTSRRRPIFSSRRITLQFTTMGVAPWSAALLGFVASLDVPVEEKNRWCPALGRIGTIDSQLELLRDGLPLEMLRRTIPELAEWNATARLNPGRSIPEHLGDPAAQRSMERLLEHYEAAIVNLEGLVGSTAASRAVRQLAR